MKKKFYCVAVSRNGRLVTDLCKCPASPNDAMAVMQLMLPGDVVVFSIVELDVSPETGEPTVTVDVYSDLIHSTCMNSSH